MIFQNQWRVLVNVFRVKFTTSEPLKRVTGRILELGSNFIEESKWFTIQYYNRNLFKIYENHQRTCEMY
jgi:hypothetical protein